MKVHPGIDIYKTKPVKLKYISTILLKVPHRFSVQLENCKL